MAEINGVRAITKLNKGLKVLDSLIWIPLVHAIKDLFWPQITETNGIETIINRQKV